MESILPPRAKRARSPSQAWTSEDEDRLLEAFCVYGEENWRNIATMVGNHRDTGNCYQHWFRSMRPRLEQKSFKLADYALLAWFVKQYGTNAWNLVATKVKGWSGHLCRLRWVELVCSTDSFMRLLRICVLGTVSEQMTYQEKTLGFIPKRLQYVPNEIMSLDEMFLLLLNVEFSKHNEPVSSSAPPLPQTTQVPAPQKESCIPMVPTVAIKTTDDPNPNGINQASNPDPNPSSVPVSSLEPVSDPAKVPQLPPPTFIPCPIVSSMQLNPKLAHYHQFLFDEEHRFPCLGLDPRESCFVGCVYESYDDFLKFI